MNFQTRSVLEQAWNNQLKKFTVTNQIRKFYFSPTLRGGGAAYEYFKSKGLGISCLEGPEGINAWTGICRNKQTKM